MTTVLEAARLVRHRISTLAPTLFDPCEIDPDTLQGACGIASYTLARVLRQVGVKCELSMGYFWSSKERCRGQHCWVTVESLDMIVDITATQFDIPSEVHVTVSDDVRYHTSLRNRQAVKDLKTWETQSHLLYKDVLDRLVSDATVQLFQSGFVSRTLPD